MRQIINGSQLPDILVGVWVKVFAEFGSELGPKYSYATKMTRVRLGQGFNHGSGWVGLNKRTVG